MALESKIYSLLTGSSVVASYVGTRIYPVILPQSPTYPAVVYQRIGSDKVNDSTGYSGLENPNIRIDALGETFSDARSLKTAILSAMSSATDFQSVCVSERSITDVRPDMSIICRKSMDFSVWNHE